MDRYSRYILGFVFAFGFLSQDVWAEDVDYYKLGKQAYRHGEYAQARQYYQQALDNAKAMGDRAEEGKILYALGNLSDDQSDYAKAREYYEESLAIFKALGDRAGEGANLGTLGIVSRHLGDYAQARDYGEQSLAIFKALGDREGESVSLNNLGNVSRHLGDYAQAREYHGQSLAISKALGNQEGEGKSLNNLGNVSKDLGDYAQAWEYYVQSLAINKAMGNRDEEGRNLINLGNVSESVGDYAQAREYYGQSLAISKALGNREGEAMSLGNLGNISYFLGDYTQAREFHRQSLAISKALGVRYRYVEGRSLGNLGTVFEALGDFAQAQEYFGQSLAILKAIGDQQGEGTTLNNLGAVSKDLGDYAQAREYFGQSLVIYKALSNWEGERVSLGNLGDTNLEQGRFREALASYNQINDSPRWGFYRLRLGEFAKAREEFLKELGRVETSRSAYLLMYRYMGLGLADEGLKNWKGSLSYFKKAVDLMETQRTQLDASARRQFFGGKMSIVKRLDAYEGLARVTLAAGNKEEGLYWAENTKARLFLEALARRESSSEFKLPDNLAKREAEVNQRIMSLGKQQDAAFNAKNTELFNKLEPELEQAKVAQAALVGKLRREQPAYAAVAYPQPLHLADIKLKPNEVLLEYEVTDSATLAWLVKDGKVVKALTIPVTREALAKQIEDYRKFFKLTAKTKAEADKELARFDPKPGKVLYDLLFKEFRPLIQDTDQLILVPDDVLAELPFEALVTEITPPMHSSQPNLNVVDTQRAVGHNKPKNPPQPPFEKGGQGGFPTGASGKLTDQATFKIPINPPFAKGEAVNSTTPPDGVDLQAVHYLADSLSLRYAQSATALVQTRQFRRAAVATGKALLVVADPVFNLTDTRLKPTTKTAQSTDLGSGQTAIRGWMAERGEIKDFDRLDSTGDSAKRLADMFGGTGQVDILTGFEANEDVVKQRLEQGYHYGLFATHGILGNNTPYLQQPALVLSLVAPDGKYLASEGTGSPGFLTLAEVMSLKIDSNLLALTACNTGRGGKGGTLLGEGVMSMGRGFQYAGVESVLMSLWSVEDNSTNLLTEKFFAYLKQGKNKLEALRLARTDLRHEGYSHPYFWASFILVGEM